MNTYAMDRVSGTSSDVGHYVILPNGAVGWILNIGNLLEE